MQGPGLREVLESINLPMVPSDGRTVWQHKCDKNMLYVYRHTQKICVGVYVCLYSYGNKQPWQQLIEVTIFKLFAWNYMSCPCLSSNHKPSAHGIIARPSVSDWECKNYRRSCRFRLAYRKEAGSFNLECEYTLVASRMTCHDANHPESVAAVRV